MRKFAVVDEWQIRRVIRRNVILPVCKEISQLFLLQKFPCLSLAALAQNVAYDCTKNTTSCTATKNPDYYYIVRHYVVPPVQPWNPR